jgi:hypothetical protein
MSEVNAGNGHGSDALLAADESQAFISGRFDADPLWTDTERCSDVCLHLLDVGEQLRLLRNESGVHVYDPAFARIYLFGRFLQKYGAGCTAPTRFCIGKEMTNIHFADSAENGVAYRMHEHIRIRVTFQTLRMGDFHAAKNETATLD